MDFSTSGKCEMDRQKVIAKYYLKVLEHILYLHILNRTGESTILSDAVEDILNPLDVQDQDENNEEQNDKKLLQEKLQYYRSAGLSNLKVFLKAEKVTHCDSK